MIGSSFWVQLKIQSILRVLTLSAQDALRLNLINIKELFCQMSAKNFVLSIMTASTIA